MQLGGLASNVVFIDGGITFRLYRIAKLAQLHGLNAEEVLQRIFISRAFTAYQLTSLVMEKLEETVKTCHAKVAIISDVAGFFLDTNIAAEEAQKIYSQLICYLADFARKHQIVVVATYLPYENSKRNMTLQQITTQNAGIVLCFTKTPNGKQLSLEKHPTYTLGLQQLPTRTITLTDFLVTNLGKTVNPTVWQSKMKFAAGTVLLRLYAKRTGKPSTVDGCMPKLCVCREQRNQTNTL
jgi:hypothetical protein